MSAEVIQGTEEWFAERLGCATASRIADVVAKTKTGESASRGTYRAELVAERLTGKRAEGFSNAAMAWGTSCEPLARASYEAVKGVFVTEVGMVRHPAIAMTGASPDGLVGADGVLEIKCPDTKTHIETVLSGKAPTKYIPQMQWQMACTGRAWCDFVSFDPRMPADMQIFIVRVDYEPELIANYESEIIKFLGEVDSTIEKLNAWKKAA